MGPVAPRHVGSSQTRARTHVPGIGRQTPNHCAFREAPAGRFLTSVPPGKSSLILFYFFLWLRWVLVAACRLSLVGVGGGYSSLRCMGFSCGGFSCCRAWALGVWASVVVERGLSSCGSRALVRRLSSCGLWASLLRGMWDLPGPGLKPVSPALVGGFLTTAPPGKSPHLFLRLKVFPLNF